MKTQLTALLLLATMSFSSIIKADETIMPVVSKPAILEEGTQRQLTPAQIAELLPWAKNSKVFLNDLFENISGLSMADKIERLIEGIKEVVPESAPKNTELLMRYALNRGLILHEILSKEMDPEAVGTIDAQYRVLALSIQMALKYYDFDMATLSKKASSPYIIFGTEYFEFLTELNKSIFDASAQYQIQRTSLEWLQWDLYRDLNNAKFAPQILKINNGLKAFPNKKLRDSQSIAYIRQMKSLSAQLRISEIVKAVRVDLELALAASEEDKRRILEARAQEAKRLAAEEAMRIEEEKRLEGEKILQSFNKGKPLPVQQLSVGMTVIYDGQSVRSIEYLTDDGQVILARVPYVSAQTVTTRNNVQKSMGSYLGLSEGSTVFYGDTIRKVEHIGERGAVVLERVPYVSAQTFTTIKGVSKTVSRYSKFEVGNKVLYNGTTRVIEYLDNNGRAVLERIAYVTAQTFVTCDQLSKIQ